MTASRSPHRTATGCQTVASRETSELAVDNTTVIATIGFDETGAPKEIFLDGGKSGSNLDFMLADASVVISIALQSGVIARALAKSIARIPKSIDGPATKAASIVGAAIDLLVTYE